MKKKICFFTKFHDFPRQRMLEYYEKLLPRNVEIFLFCKKGEIEKFHTKRAKKVPFTSSDISVFRELRRFCKENQIDILTNLSRRLKVALMMIAATLGTKTKVVFYDHGNPKKKVIALLAPFQFFFYRVLLAAPDLTNKVRSIFFFTRKRVSCLPTAIDTNYFTPVSKKEKLRLRKSLGLSSKDQVIGFLGRIQWMKGSDFLLRAIQRNPDKKFVLIGAAMDENYDFSNLPNVIHVESAPKPKVRDLLRTMDLFLFMSRSEGLGLSNREAMACGIPTITSNIEALKTIPGSIKVPFDDEIIQKEIDTFFKLSQKERSAREKKTRDLTVSNYSEQALKSVHCKYLLP